MNYKISRMIMKIGLFAGLLVILIGALVFQDETSQSIYVGAVIMVTAIFQSYLFYKCPHCKQGFDIAKEPPERCPKCKRKLESKQEKQYKNSKTFCSPRSMDRFLMVQLSCTLCTTHCTICESVHVNVDAAERFCCFIFVEIL